MNRIADCVADIVNACAADDEGGALMEARARVDRFFDDLKGHVKTWPNQDGSRERGALEDQLTAASTNAARQGARVLSDRLERIIDEVHKRRQ